MADFHTTLYFEESAATITMAGSLDASTAPQLQQLLIKAAKRHPSRLVLDATELTFMASAGLRCLVFARQKMGSEVSLAIAGASDGVLATIRMAGFHRSVELVER
jgi:anti-anti-sigma factor